MWNRVIQVFKNVVQGDPSVKENVTELSGRMEIWCRVIHVDV